MDGWFSGLVAAKMEEIIINFTKNLMITNMSNYNSKTHHTGGDSETNDQNYFEKLANNDKQEHQEDSDGKSHLNNVTHNLLKGIGVRNVGVYPLILPPRRYRWGTITQ